MDQAALQAFVEDRWESSVLPVLDAYIRIPNKSPAFDPDWQAHGHMERAVALIEAWCRAREIAGLSVEVVRLPGRTPLLFMEIPGTGAGHGTVLLYGHLDKQPEFSGWSEGTGPWQPVRRGDRLYGRGGADDGYAAFAALTGLEAVQRQGLAHARCVVLIEACEESGSGDLPAYVEHLKKRIGDVRLVICLDSGCGDYQRLWTTTSLRGLVVGTLKVEILRQGVHSGDASGVVPSSFRIARTLLSRIEREQSGEVRLRALHVPIPRRRIAEARATAKVLGRAALAGYPWVEGAKPVTRSASEALLNRTWRPALSIVGAEGLPAPVDAGNVLRPGTALVLSMRIPPTCDVARATRALKQALEARPPYGARVRFETDKGSPGWNAPARAPWLEAAIASASSACFGKSACAMGEGGSIPFMAMLGEQYPRAQFMITGVLGPESNAHGPNEFLHVPTAKRVTACVAHVIAAHARHGR
jgi:acetylornithine deacetylase/succinyl-diaminopimelate desuccinylase-like protein